MICDTPKLICSPQKNKNYYLLNSNLKSSLVGEEEELTLSEPLDLPIQNLISKKNKIYAVLHINNCDKEFVEVLRYNSQILLVKRGVSNFYNNHIDTTKLKFTKGKYQSLYVTFDDIPPFANCECCSSKTDSISNTSLLATKKTKGLIYSEYTPTSADENYKPFAVTSDNPSFVEIKKVFFGADGVQSNGNIKSPEGYTNLTKIKNILNSSSENTMLLDFFFGTQRLGSNQELSEVAINRFNLITNYIKTQIGIS